MSGYTDLATVDRVAILHAMIKNAEGQLVQARANQRIQDRFLASPLPGHRKEQARQARTNFDLMEVELQISIDVLREELAALEATLPQKEGDGEHGSDEQ